MLLKVLLKHSLDSGADHKYDEPSYLYTRDSLMITA